MRIDKYLKVTRLIKRRSVANEACDQGRITVNGRESSKRHHMMSRKMILSKIKMGGKRIIKVQVMAIAEHVLKNDASSLYKPLS